MNEDPKTEFLHCHKSPGQRIAIRRLSPNRSDAPQVLFCGGFRSSMRGNKAQFLLDHCQSSGWGLTLFDYRGHGESDGDPEVHDLIDWLDDILQILASSKHPQILVGSSMGAWLSIHAALQLPQNVHSLITIAAAPDFAQELLYPSLTDTQRQALLDDKAVAIPTHYDSDPWQIRQSLFTSAKKLSVLSTEKRIKLECCVRMLHGLKDVDVPWQLSKKLLSQLACDNASLTLIQHGDHRLSDEIALAHLRIALLDVTQS